MQISIEPLIYIGIFVGVIMLVNGVYLMVFGKSISFNARVNRRLTMLEKGSSREDVLAKLRKELDQHTKSRTIPLYSLIADKAQKANIAFTPQQLILVMIGMTMVAFLLLTLLTGASLPIRLLVSVGMGVGGVYYWVNSKAKKRIAMIEEQLPDAVELMVRSLRVGHPFVSAINTVAKEVADPLGSELGIIADEAAYGRDIAESIENMAERLDLQDLRFMAVAVGIQQTSGGNLAEILAGLANVIRARFKLFRRVKAITAEAKWSGMFLSVFPILCLIGINVMQPDYYSDVMNSPVFIPACAVVGVMLFVNVIFMRMMVNIKV
ncbi:pilus assembly protein TadB [Roseobacter sp. HKCCD9010]|jgi:tight adherence protein B|uniref:type II secretion system F family protein n=1 Tax=Rhodobacterales TaxID=204455 RepID=UPI001198F076|nr:MULTISPECIES: type II secretion system F family protein [Rhodobacterales]MBF9049138.1 pilus assembly protein TadB [Rhodobacterales bacterium HKCCD4356]NNV11138.1 pilus assembly protein TadB [Roseobacter sp. HKCCD7357]NNV15322.1 pilus assembly protein TadB [Roseobacter sp. HKCCD8768]NNV24782.1 pilus assembly protein TadB [Roseobacter sp. HKCCD8192]NNV29038.1 pilus assembly protein TadB [Roseobacter sp. HKCCD9061]